MILLSLLFLAFISTNIILNSVKTKNINNYISEIEKDLNQKVSKSKIEDNKII